MSKEPLEFANVWNASLRNWNTISVVVSKSNGALSVGSLTGENENAWRSLSTTRLNLEKQFRKNSEYCSKVHK